MTRRWIVSPGDGDHLGAILAHLGSLDALPEGRVFVGRRRAQRPDEPLAPGDTVTVFAPRATLAEPRLLASHDGVLALFKPAPLPTQPDHHGDRCLLSWAEQHLKTGPLHATSRLDVGVSGAVLVARTPEASRRLLEARGRGAYRRTYLAIATRPPTPPSGVWNLPIGQGRHARQRAVHGRSPETAESHFAVLALAPGGQALLRLHPITGRTHQLRVHAAHAGSPLLGDRLYGGPPRLVAADGSVTPLDRIALHAWRIEVPDASGKPWSVTAPADELHALWASVGGDWPDLEATALEPPSPIAMDD